MITLLLVGHHAGGVYPDQTTSLSLLPVSMWLFLYVFSCGRPVLLVFRSVSEAGSIGVVVLVCPRGVSLGSSSFAIGGSLVIIFFTEPREDTWRVRGTGCYLYLSCTYSKGYEAGSKAPRRKYSTFSFWGQTSDFQAQLFFAPLTYV